MTTENFSKLERKSFFFFFLITFSFPEKRERISIFFGGEVREGIIFQNISVHAYTNKFVFVYFSFNPRAVVHLSGFPQAPLLLTSNYYFTISSQGLMALPLWLFIDLPTTTSSYSFVYSASSMQTFVLQSLFWPRRNTDTPSFFRGGGECNSCKVIRCSHFLNTILILKAFFQL